MNRDALLERVRAQMPDKRWLHTVGVMETSVELAKRFGADPVKADLAALLHDAAKFWPIERQRQVAEEAELPAMIFEYDPQLLHAPVGAYYAERECGIDDAEVLDAVRYHTSGRAGMTLLEKVVCLADYIEPGRSFPGVHEIRQLAESNINQALVAGFDSTLTLLIAKGKRIFPPTVEARNALIQELADNRGN